MGGRGVMRELVQMCCRFNFTNGQTDGWTGGGWDDWVGRQVDKILSGCDKC